MTYDYDLFALVLEFERAAVDYGQYIMAGMFAYVVTVFVLGNRMTRAMLSILTAIYSVYVWNLSAGVYFASMRAAELAKVIVGEGVFENGAEGYASSAIVLTSFWLVSHIATLGFALLVRRRALDSPGT